MGKPQARQPQRRRPRSRRCARPIKPCCWPARCWLGGAAAAAGADRVVAVQHGAGDRPADCRALCRQPALHHGPGGHAFLRPRRVLRPRCLCCRLAGAEGRLADGGRAAGRAAGGRPRGGGVRLVLRAAVGRVPGDADAGVRADRLVDHLPVGRLHRRQQRPDRRLAGGLAEPTRRRTTTLVLVLVAGGVLALRRILFSPFGYAMRAGRDSPLRADAIGIDVKRVQWAAFVVAGGGRGAGGLAVCLQQGQHLARQHGRGQVGRRPGDGAARRRADAGRPAGRRRHLHLAAGHRGAQHRLLARAAGRHHPAAGAGLPAGHRRLHRPAVRAPLAGAACGRARAG